MKRRILVLASLALLNLSGRSAAQEPAYVDDLRFVNELRQRGDTDLALDLLNRLAKNASPQLLNELPFEMALCRKAEAANETDSGKRLKLYEQARAELVKFRDSNPNHPRLADTKIDITDITVQEGKTQMSQAMAREGVAAQSAGLEEARKKFEAAAVELKAINTELEARLAPLQDPKTPVERATRAKLEKTRIRAEFSVALNLFDIAQTYHGKHSKAEVLIERGNRMETAKKALQKVAGNDDSISEVWQARAWLGRCEHELGKPKTAREQFAPIIESRSAAAADGARLARYFRLLAMQEQLQSGQAEKTDDVNTLIDGGRRWVRDYPRSLTTPEGNGMRFLLAESLLAAAAGEKTPAAQKKEYSEEARKLLDALADAENEYTDRARDLQIRLIVSQGGTTKDVSKLETFDQCYIRAQYEIMEMSEDAKKLKGTELEAKRAERVKTLLAALDRGLKMPDAPKGGTKVNNARAMIAYWYLNSGKFVDAYRAGEKFVKDDPRSSQAALAAAYALQAYGASIATRENVIKNARAGEFADDQGKKITEAEYVALLEKERTQMLDFAAYCEKIWAKELAGNLARHQIGMMLMRNGKIAECIKVLGSITPEYPSYTAIQSQIADVSLKADADKVEPIAIEARGEKAPVPWRERGQAALRGVAEPTGPDTDQNLRYYQARIRLGNELYRDRKFAEMEAIVAPLLPKVTATTFHATEKTNGEIREYFRTQLTKVRLYAKVGEADVSFKANDYKKVSDLADPVLKDLKADAIPQIKADPQIGQLLQALMVMALQANVQLGDLDKVKQVVEVFGKAMGEDQGATAVPEVLRRLVPIIRTQVRNLKEKGDTMGLGRATTAFTAILDDLKKQQKQQPTPAEFLLVLAQCYGSMDQTEKAIEVLEAIAKPKDDDLEGQKIYQASRLTYLRQLRQRALNEPAKKEEIFKKSTALLNEWMGTKEKPGWAAKIIDAHKERLYLSEMDDDTGGGFNKAQALVKTLSAKITDPNDQVAKGHYLECYYYMVYFLYMNGKKAGMAGNGPDPRKTAEAASRIVSLEEQYKDFGNEEIKLKFTKLLDAEPPLKAQYEKLRKK